MSKSKPDSSQSALDKFEARRLKLRKEYFGTPERPLEAAIREALSGLEWHAELVDRREREPQSDDEIPFVRNGRKIVANNQHNIIAALRAMRVQFFDKGGDNLNPFMRYPGANEFELGDNWPMSQLWLAMDRRFGFRPSFSFFQTVLGDYGRRQTGMDGLEAESSQHTFRWQD